MKKTSLILLIMTYLFIVIGCSAPGKIVVNVLFPAGAPAVAVAKMIVEEKELDNSSFAFQISYGSDPLAVGFTSGSHDIILAPTNMGANIYQKKSDYILAGVFFWGSNYIVTKKDYNIKSIDDLSGHTILAFGQNATPDAVLQTVLHHHGVMDNVTIEYVLDVTTAMQLFVNQSKTIILTSEPQLTQLNISFDFDVIDLQQEWLDMTGYHGYPQVGIFVKKSALQTKETLIGQFLDRLDSDIEWMYEHPEVYAEIAVGADDSLGRMGAEVIATSIGNIRYQFQNASDAKDALLSYFQVLYHFNPNLIGGKIPNDEFFWNKETE